MSAASRGQFVQGLIEASGGDPRRRDTRSPGAASSEPDAAHACVCCADDVGFRVADHPAARGWISALFGRDLEDAPVRLHDPDGSRNHAGINEWCETNALDRGLLNPSIPVRDDTDAPTGVTKRPQSIGRLIADGWESLKGDAPVVDEQIFYGLGQAEPFPNGYEELQPFGEAIVVLFVNKGPGIRIGGRPL